MKTRNGFVSNSSSSSFIVALKGRHRSSTKVKIEVEVDLADYGELIDTLEELQKYYKEENYLDDEEIEIDDSYRLAKKAIEKGGTVVVGSFSSEGNGAVEHLLCDMGLRDIIRDKNVEIIEGEGGYWGG